VRLAQDVEQRPVHVRVKRGRALGHPLGEHRGGLEQVESHACPLRALPGEHEHRVAPPCGTAGGHVRGELAPAERGQSRQQLVAVRTGYGGAVGERGAGGDERVGDVERFEAGVRRQVCEQTGGLPGERLARPAGQHPCRPRRGPGGFRRVTRLVIRWLFEHDVRVGAADAERRHTGTPGPVARRPGRRFAEQPDGSGRPVHMRCRLVHMQRPRHHTMPHRQHHLDHTSNTSSSLRMTKIRLHRTKPQRTTNRTTLPVRLQQRLRLNRITQHSPRAMRLHNIHIRRDKPSGIQRLADHPLLRRTIRRRQPIRRTILIHRTTTHHGQHLVPGTSGIGQPLEHQHADPLAPAGPVRRRGERLAPAVGSERALPGEVDEVHRGGHDRHAAGEGEGALAPAQRLGGHVQCHER